MDVFKDLYIEGGEKSLEKTMSLIDQALGNGWIRDKVREAEYLKRVVGSDIMEALCVNCPASEDYPESVVWLIRSPGCIKLTNIVPKEVGNLSHKQYNLIFDQFYKNFAQNAIKGTGVSLRLSKGEVSAEDLLGKKVAALFSSFSVCANKSTGSRHPCDQERWFDFVVACHLNDCKISTEELSRLLLADGWGDRETSDLVCEYEYSRYLLKGYDNRRRKGK